MASVATAIKAAESKIGARYVWGAEGPSTFDCSGLMLWAWQKAGVRLPRTSQEQAKFGTAVQPSKIQPGDLVTSDWGSGPSSHVAMYIGGGKVIHAPRPGRTVTVATMDANYRRHVNAIRRVPGASLAGVTASGFPSPEDLWEWEQDWTKKLLGGDPGGAAESFGEGALGFGSALLGPLKTAAAALGDVASGMLSVGRFAEFLLKLALPSTWVRIVCGVAGIVLLLLGVWFLVREAWGVGA